MNAIEHGNKNEPERPVRITAEVTDGDLVVRVQDEGAATPIPIVETPDIGAKLSGDQSARGWGLFLIQEMVDQVRVTTEGPHHVVELLLHLEEASDA